jgi:hypothetical protein
MITRQVHMKRSIYRDYHTKKKFIIVWLVCVLAMDNSKEEKKEAFCVCREKKVKNDENLKKNFFHFDF